MLSLLYGPIPPDFLIQVSWSPEVSFCVSPILFHIRMISILCCSDTIVYLNTKHWVVYCSQKIFVKQECDLLTCMYKVPQCLYIVLRMNFQTAYQGKGRRFTCLFFCLYILGPYLLLSSCLSIYPSFMYPYPPTIISTTVGKNPLEEVESPS